MIHLWSIPPSTILFRGLALAALAALLPAACGEAEEGNATADGAGGAVVEKPLDDGPAPTWDDVAPILYEECAECHRPVGPGPFSVLAPDSVRPHATRIAEMVDEGRMPPWSPARARPFRGARELTEAERAALVRWAEAGAPVDDPAAAPSAPAFPPWPLGSPDRIVEAPRPFVVPARGEDVFRNFVVPTDVERPRWVRAVDLRPGDPGVVHHGFLHVDRTGAARRLAAEDEVPGFPGMELGAAHPPDEQMLGWTPGRSPHAGWPGVAWRLEPGMDLVLQLHMLPSGAPDTVRPEIGLYLADEPPERKPVLMTLTRRDLDIPAGEDAYVVRDSVEIPVAAEVLSVYPHAHFVGKSIEAWAETPAGERIELIRIPRWDFRWQDQYYYREPLALPAGSRVFAVWTYDNTRDNPLNPNDPPRRVTFGLGSHDEMAELHLQLVAASEARRWDLVAARSRHLLEVDPNDWMSMFNLGIVAEQRGDLERAIGWYERTVRLHDTHALAHYNLGSALLQQGKIQEARPHLTRAVELAPDLADAHYNLGYALAAAERPADAIPHLATATELDPANGRNWLALGNAHISTGDPARAERAFREALELDPRDVGALNGMGNVLLAQGRPRAAAERYRQVLRINPGDPYARNNLRIAEARIAGP